MIVDMHIHLGRWSTFHVVDASPDAIISLMAELGVGISVFSHHAWLANEFERGYEASVNACEQAAGKLYYYAVFNPRYSDISLYWARKALNNPGCVGIKIHPAWHVVYPDQDEYEPVYQLAEEFDVPILAHSWSVSDYNPVQQFSTPDHFERYARLYPKVNLILAHAGGRYEGHLAAAELMKRCENVFCDFSADVCSLGIIEWFAAQVGAERMLYGTDIPWADPRIQLAKMLDANITLSQKELILCDNAQRIFRF
jgi:predicted TIM-barrel fold metal-dependent hydrolase